MFYFRLGLLLTRVPVHVDFCANTYIFVYLYLKLKINLIILFGQRLDTLMWYAYNMPTIYAYICKRKHTRTKANNIGAAAYTCQLRSANAMFTGCKCHIYELQITYLHMTNYIVLKDSERK